MYLAQVELENIKIIHYCYSLVAISYDSSFLLELRLLWQSLTAVVFSTAKIREAFWLHFAVLDKRLPMRLAATFRKVTPAELAVFSHRTWSGIVHSL